ncbi:sigma-54 interaction domain-containing protein [Marinococcus halophilus]|uniref:sigma-54 interaction domain-containing protein n=1 Tax=Marinococcus halophilus TaxID=1371 RepID=UPI0015C451C2|nr:sigma 54-interacting transcriptional regulator [Marinococcus halophilus]
MENEQEFFEFQKQDLSQELFTFNNLKYILINEHLRCKWTNHLSCTEFLQYDNVTKQVKKVLSMGKSIENITLTIEKEQFTFSFFSFGQKEVLIIFQIINQSVLQQIHAYQEHSEDLKAIFDSSFDVIYVSDYKGKTLRVSAASKQLWDQEPKEIIGKNTSRLESEGVYTPSVTRLVLEKRKKVSTIQSTKTGKRLMVVGTPIQDPEGNIKRVVNASRDITEINQLQSELSETKNLAEAYKLELESLREKHRKENKIIYRSQEMEKTIRIADKVAQADSTVLITGESGVGKEEIATYLHENSKRSKKPYIKINCGAVPETLLEAELFGYEKGAFTGAHPSGKKGLMELSHHGTLFLDEISEMPFSLQVKLLRVLQEKEITRIGSTTPITIDVRIITATNQDLLKEVKKGSFREDLYYRLNVIPISIPALRKRKEDVSPLAFHFMDKLNDKYNSSKKLSPKVMNELQLFDWPGNVRELQNIIERMVVLSESNLIEPEDLPEIIKTNISSSSTTLVQDIMPLKACLESAEEQLLKLAQEKYSTITQIAEALHVNQSTISRKLAKLRSVNEDGH